MGEIDPEVYFSFGTFLNEQLTKNEKVEKLTHEYLNLFRFSSLLRRIYEKKIWEPLIHELITKSNYNTAGTFQPEIKRLQNKNSFQINKWKYCYRIKLGKVC